MDHYHTALITDSACDLPDTLLADYQIGLVPLVIHWGDDQLRDRFDIQPPEFYRRLVADPVHPKTAHPAPQDFLDAVCRAQMQGAREAIIITISSGMSGSYDAARQGVRGAVIPVHIIDSRANSLSQGWQVLAAARVRAAGGSTREMLAVIEQVRQRLATHLYLDTLEYLYRGGRIGRAQKWIGTMLNIKPILWVNHATGVIEPLTRARSQQQAVETLVNEFFRALGPGPLHVGLVHGGIPDQAAALAARIQHDYAPAELLTVMPSPVMAVHTGPGALALCGCAGDF